MQSIVERVKEINPRGQKVHQELPIALEDVVSSQWIDTSAVQCLRLKRISQQALANGRYYATTCGNRYVKSEVRKLRNEIDDFKRGQLNNAYGLFEGCLMSLNPFLEANALSKDAKEKFVKRNKQYQEDIAGILKEQIKDCKEQVTCLHEGCLTGDPHFDYDAWVKALRDQFKSLKQELGVVNDMTDFINNLALSMSGESVDQNDSKTFRFDK